ncbi:predicted protein, partial [Nematostella vectensis]
FLLYLDCGDNLGLVSGGIHDYQLSASSYESGEGEPWYGRLGDSTKKNWCASTQDTNQYLQIDLGPNEHSIMAVATQGAHNYDSWVLTYTMSVSHDGKTWEDYKEGGSLRTLQIFEGNWDRDTVVTNRLHHNITARYLRFDLYMYYQRPSIRAEVY